MVADTYRGYQGRYTPGGNDVNGRHEPSIKRNPAGCTIIGEPALGRSRAGCRPHVN